MNTSFKILWFEDEPTWYNMEKLRIEGILREHQLVPSITRRSGEDFTIQELTGNDYDLILMDFKLDELTGDKIVSEIRNNNVLTDILFYSSEEDNMLNAIRRQMPPIDGVYLTKRDYTVFTEKASKLISKIVRRSEDVVNLRGFVLDNTSDFELRIKEILNICWQKVTPQEKDTLSKTLSKVLDGKVSFLNAKVSQTRDAECPFEHANNEKRLLSIADRLDILQAVLELLSTQYHMPTTTCPTNFKDYYIDRVNMYRNQLGHVKLGDKTICIKGKEVEINQALHRLLRKNIAEVDRTIAQLEDFVTTRI